jgi:hypothetical protein
MLPLLTCRAYFLDTPNGVPSLLVYHGSNEFLGVELELRAQMNIQMYVIDPLHKTGQVYGYRLRCLQIDERLVGINPTMEEQASLADNICQIHSNIDLAIK